MRMTYILIEGENDEEKEDGNGKEINERKVIYISFWFMIASNGSVQVYSSERRKVTQVLLNIKCFSSGRGDNKRG